MGAPDRLVVARFGAPHGVRGEVRLKSFTEDPLAVLDYGPLSAADGRTFELKSARPAAGKSPDMLVVTVAGIGSRNAVEPLNGIELTVSRSILPEPEGEDDYYHADLIGLAAVTTEGAALGTVVAVHNHGAGDLLEIAPVGAPSLLVPFTREVVPEIAIGDGRIVVDPPAGLLDDDGDEDVEAEAELGGDGNSA